MPNPTFTTGNYYHIYNRGVEKRNIFLNYRDYSRFLSTVDYYRKTPLPAKLSDFIRGLEIKKIIENQIELVNILCYCFMPNHFHFLVQQITNSGITNFLKKISNSYTRYFNTKYDRIGPLMQGTFKAKLIESDEYLLQLSKYIHCNPKENHNSCTYPYSSYKYYLSKETHPFCDKNFILSYFSRHSPNLSYKSFVEEFQIDNSNVYSLLLDAEE